MLTKQNWRFIRAMSDVILKASFGSKGCDNGSPLIRNDVTATLPISLQTNAIGRHASECSAVIPAYNY